MAKVVIVGKPTPEIARLIEEKGLDIDFITEGEAAKRFEANIMRLPSLDKNTIESLVKKVNATPKAPGKSKYF